MPNSNIVSRYADCKLYNNAKCDNENNKLNNVINAENAVNELMGVDTTVTNISSLTDRINKLTDEINKMKNDNTKNETMKESSPAPIKETFSDNNDNYKQPEKIIEYHYYGKDNNNCDECDDKKIRANTDSVTNDFINISKMNLIVIVVIVIFVLVTIFIGIQFINNMRMKYYNMYKQEINNVLGRCIKVNNNNNGENNNIQQKENMQGGGFFIPYNLSGGNVDNNNII